MLLQPRTIKSKKIQKNRKRRSFNTNFKLKYGSVGLILLRPIQLTADNIFRLKLFLKRSMKKTDKTRRMFWFQSFPHLPLSKKPVGVRMGKGKGKLECWFTNVRKGTTLVEFKNLRLGRAIFFVKQLKFKLGVPVRSLISSQLFLSLPFRNKKTRFKNFW